MRYRASPSYAVSLRHLQTQVLTVWPVGAPFSLSPTPTAPRVNNRRLLESTGRGQACGDRHTSRVTSVVCALWEVLVVFRVGTANGVSAVRGKPTRRSPVPAAAAGAVPEPLHPAVPRWSPQREHVRARVCQGNPFPCFVSPEERFRPKDTLCSPRHDLRSEYGGTDAELPPPWSCLLGTSTGRKGCPVLSCRGGLLPIWGSGQTRPGQSCLQMRGGLAGLGCPSH